MSADAIMAGAIGPEARRRFTAEVTKVEGALELWLAWIVDLCEYPTADPEPTDGLELSTTALFDSVPVAALLYVLNRRDKEDA